MSQIIPSTFLICQGLALVDAPFQEVGQWGLNTLWYQDEHYGVL